MIKNNYDLDYNTRKISNEFGAIIKDVVVLSRKNISKIKIMIPQAKEYKYSVNVNDFMLVFQKPEILEKIKNQKI